MGYKMENSRLRAKLLDALGRLKKLERENVSLKSALGQLRKRSEAMSNEKRTCGTCGYSQVVECDCYYCHLDPPIQSIWSEEANWPWVPTNGWCGSWRSEAAIKDMQCYDGDNEPSDKDSCSQTCFVREHLELERLEAEKGGLQFTTKKLRERVAERDATIEGLGNRVEELWKNCGELETSNGLLRHNNDKLREQVAKKDIERDTFAKEFLVMEKTIKELREQMAGIVSYTPSSKGKDAVIRGLKEKIVWFEANARDTLAKIRKLEAANMLSCDENTMLKDAAKGRRLAAKGAK